MGSIRDWAHPRSRGADTSSACSMRYSAGSSPLARGGHEQGLPVVVDEGLIPARAGRTSVERTSKGMPWAHPRSRGADVLRLVLLPKAPGSSPLARGGLPARAARRADRGLIPARAGRTPPTPRATWPGRAHPRSRGADLVDISEMWSWLGSSPLARGGPHLLPVSDLCAGLIPARAGRTGNRRRPRSPSWAHPRSRGADEGDCSAVTSGLGSSPLARGGRPLVDGLELFDGLIPARAGRTRTPASSATTARAHPRSRGADITPTSPTTPARGSSPLARGGPELVLSRHRLSGLIPARAGRTVWSSSTLAATRAHPRSRGADWAGRSVRWRGMGSSPLARGGLRAVGGDLRAVGLIPARAGRTGWPVLVYVQAWAHPRSRGADSQPYARGNGEQGSSPLARGGHRGHPRRLRRHGLIPARAGRTGEQFYNPTTIRAHPRSRGADGDGRPELHDKGGSSPLARGGLVRLGADGERQGLIPARAGRTGSATRASQGTRAHPRSRGADTRIATMSCWARGSSPLARGGHHPDFPDHTREGLIPARAGRTCRSSRTRCAKRAHPRSRGADVESSSRVAGMRGSSPLARGGLLPSSRVYPTSGLIPARAGRTARVLDSDDPAGAHPRSRGADALAGPEPVPATGSSPLARGGRRSRRDRHGLHGLIPARAGRTTAPTPRPCCRRAHPRSRGADLPARAARRADPGLIPARAGRTRGHLRGRRPRGAHPRSRGADGDGRPELHDKGGSSPLARGGLTGGSWGGLGWGLIPARAGRTSQEQSQRAPIRAHPRSRGADIRVVTIDGEPWGSSPLARGGPHPRHRRPEVLRLIPARAGRTDVFAEVVSR